MKLQKITATHQMATRTNAEKRKASTLLSPFNSRAVVASDRLELLERKMIYWIMTDTLVNK